MFPPNNVHSSAEKQIISDLINMPFFEASRINRLLAVYPTALPEAKDAIILELMDQFWRISDINDGFSAFKDLDLLLKSLGKKGHFRHQFEVFLIGLSILSCLYDDILSLNILDIDTKEDIFLGWLMASTAHDIGYSVEFSKKIAGKFADLYNGSRLNRLGNLYQQISEQYDFMSESNLKNLTISNDSNDSITVNLSDFLIEAMRTSGIPKIDIIKILNALETKENHGYIGSLILINKYFQYIYQTKGLNQKEKTKKESILKQAGVAIALHSPPKYDETWYKLMNFDHFPFAFILFLVDNLQEWDRENEQSDRWPNYRLTSFVKRNKSFTLTYTLNHDRWTEQLIDESRGYVEKQRGQLEELTKRHKSLGVSIHLTYLTNSQIDLGKYHIDI